MWRFVDAFVPARLGPAFRWLLAASWTSNLGDGIAMAAGPLLVAALTDNPVLVSLASLMRWAPPLLFGLAAGVLSDRVRRRRIMLVGNGIRMAVLAGLAIALATGHLTATAALVALGLLGVAEVFVDNTASTLTPMLVHRDDLSTANARLMTGVITLNQLAGPAVGAVLFTVGAVWPYAANAVIMAAAVLLLTRVRLPLRDGEPEAWGGGVLTDLVEGLRWTVRHPAVRTLSLTILVFNVTYGAAWSVLVLYAQQWLGLGAIGFGLLTTVTAIGGLAGTAAYGWITRRVSLGNVMRVGLIIETVTHLVLALTTSPWLASAVLFVFGAHAFIWGTTVLTVRQRAVPERLQGRVNGVYTIALYGGLVVGAALAGPIVEQGEVTAPFWFAFAGSALLVVAIWRQLTQIAHTDEARSASRPQTVAPR